ncbi:MAG: hypothetical protein C0594_16415 [Marinilabiliales bacterium]|nr:MAG: hypothetical protein C0594_16415 [Marinilabiliales bacterium]
MKNVQKLHTYTDKLLNRIVTNMLPFYDLWSIRSLENQRYEYISGNCNETEKFSQFISEYSNGDNPQNVLLVLGNSEKNYPTVMLNTSKKYMSIRFMNNSDYLGEPLFIPPYFFDYK